MRPTYCPYCGRQLLEEVEVDYLSHKLYCPICPRYLTIKSDINPYEGKGCA